MHTNQSNAKCQAVFKNKWPRRATAGGVTTPIWATGEIVEPLTPPDHKITLAARNPLPDGVTPGVDDGDVLGDLHYHQRHRFRVEGAAAATEPKATTQCVPIPTGQTLLSHLASQGWDRYAPHPPDQWL